MLPYAKLGKDTMRKHIESGPVSALCQQWEEVEVGWGERPDGFSLHLTWEGLHMYIQRCADRDRGFSEYSRPDGKPYWIGVSAVLAESIRANSDTRYFGAEYAYPGDGGMGTWHDVD